jgi:hypothetical protein
MFRLDPALKDYLRELLTVLPKASTSDDCEALLPWRMTPRD